MNDRIISTHHLEIGQLYSLRNYLFLPTGFNGHGIFRKTSGYSLEVYFFALETKRFCTVSNVRYTATRVLIEKEMRWAVLANQHNPSFDYMVCAKPTEV